MASTLGDVTWPVRTERLTLRAASERDAEKTWRYRRLSNVNQWLTSAPQTLDEFSAQFATPERLAKTLVIELDGTVIGDLMVAVEDAWAQSEVADLARRDHAVLGWVLHPDYTGCGYAAEAVREVLRVCFEDLGLRRVIANCFADNEASWRLMERVGMRREQHTVKDSLHRSGQWLDGMSYALLAEEWQGSPAH